MASLLRSALCAGFILLEVFVMPSSLQASSPPAVFCGKTHCGWFVAVNVEQAPMKRDTGIPGISIVGYRVTLQANAVLPEVEEKHFTVVGQKGEGFEAGALGLEDWLPTMPGDMRVLAFDADNFTHAKYAIYLGGGAQARSVWRDCELFAACIRPEAGLDPTKVANTIAQPQPPLVSFFRLVTEYDRAVWNDEKVLRAMAGYLENSSIPPLDRRAILAHYFVMPTAATTETLRKFSEGMVHLAVELIASNQIASSGVILERLRAFFETAPGTYAFEAPNLSRQEQEQIARLLASNETGASESTRSSLHGWLLGE